MRMIWGTHSFPSTAQDFASAKAVGATEIVQIPCPALPNLALGFQSIVDPETTAIMAGETAAQAMFAEEVEGVVGVTGATGATGMSIA